MKSKLNSTESHRILSIDVYRGLVMLLLFTQALRLNELAESISADSFLKSPLQWLANFRSHSEWSGSSLNDFFQPSFAFIVGLALPLSLKKQSEVGRPRKAVVYRILRRSLLLIAIGIFLVSIGREQTNWVFENTLTQIGLAYFPLFLLCHRSSRTQWSAFFMITIGYWAAFALFPLPPPEFDFSTVRNSAEWMQAHGLTGFAAHWNKNTNLATAFDRWFLNLFPRKSSFVGTQGGYATLNFIPTLGTMLLGLIASTIAAGTKKNPMDRFKELAGIGVVLLGSGFLAHLLGICPIVKRIWTPSWVLWSGGLCFLAFAFLYWLVDLKKKSGWTSYFVILGTNSLTAFLLFELTADFFQKNVQTHLGWFFQYIPMPLSIFVNGFIVIGIFSAILSWMHRHRITIKL